MAKKYLDYDGLLYFWQKLKTYFVPQTRTVNGHALSTDVTVTATDIGVASGAEVNVIDTVKVNGTALTVTNKAVDVPVPTKTSDLTNDSDFISDASYVHTDNNFTTTLKNKLDGIAEGATANTGTVTSVRVQATSPVQSSTSTAQTSTLNTTISLANGYGDTKNPYASKTANQVLASPNGSNGTPSFRFLTANDIPDLQGIYVTNAKIGSADGVCPLDASSKVDASYLPSYVDDVVEAYPRSGATELSSTWLSLTSGGSALTPETGVIYILMADSTSYSANTQFRWSGTTYVKLADGGVSSITNSEIDTIVAS